MRTTFLLQDFVFQINSDFISNSNLNGCGLLPHPYISSYAPPPHPSTPILPQNQTLAATQTPSHHRCWGCRPKSIEVPKLNLTLEHISWRTITPRMHFLMNLHHEMMVTAHLHLVCRIESATRSSSRSGKSLQRSQGCGGSMSEVIPAPKARRR
jgi:hypothetical protein